MNKKPDAKANSQRNSIEVFLLACKIALIAVGAMYVVGCADSAAVPTPPSVATATHEHVVAEKTESLDPAPQDQETAAETQDEQTEEAESGVLEKAGKLFDKAKKKSGSTASGATKWVKDKIGGAADASTQTADDTWKWANETFESLKSQGLTSAKDTSEWLGQDWQNMESWQYKVTTLTGSDDELAKQLNVLGEAGWECYSTEAKVDGIRFYFKKPKFSYLRQLPFKDVIKLVPMMNNGEK